ncbi:MAG: hypothetical protein E7162_01460 [Firmicutes bacterium]|nr:hypothetical protein [Bacillota bacterium]
MIKVIAFDLVGVLVREKDIELNEIESKIERLFGPNISDLEYFEKARLIFSGDIISITKDLVNKLYEVKDKNLINKIKKNFPNIKIVIATNHVSFIRDFIEKELIVDDIIISAEINMIKPNSNFYNYLLDKYKIEASELLFLDDNIENIDGAYKLGINTIKVDKNTNIYEEILHKIK